MLCLFHSVPGSLAYSCHTLHYLDIVFYLIYCLNSDQYISWGLGIFPLVRLFLGAKLEPNYAVLTTLMDSGCDIHTSTINSALLIICGQTSCWLALNTDILFLPPHQDFRVWVNFLPFHTSGHPPFLLTSSKGVDTLICYTTMCRNTINFLYIPDHMTL